MKRRQLTLLLAGLVLLGLPVSARVAPIHRAAMPLAPVHVAFTWHNNVYLINADGTNRHAITTRATATNNLSYPWYQWSPDGKYLLLVRQSPERRWDLLLMDANGNLIRTLVTGAPATSDFNPSWAADADQIAYVAETAPAASSSAGPSGTSPTVDRVDILGNRAFLWRYTSYEGCGGGGADPAMGLHFSETGYESTAPTLWWSVTRNVALFSASCGNTRITVTNIRTQISRPLDPQQPIDTSEATLSPAVKLAVVVGLEVDGSSHVALTSLRSGAPIQNVAAGELPRWSRDGRFLYFAQRTKGQVLSMRDETGGGVNDMATYTSSIWRINADGTHPVQLLSENAYGFGPLQLTPDDQSLIFSRVDNVWNLWQHRLPGNGYTADLLQRYGPTVQIQRLNLASGKLVTLAHDAGRPAVQP